MNIEVLGTCPLCGKKFEFSYTIIDKEYLLKHVKKDSFDKRLDIIYKGSKFVATHSIAFLLNQCNVPYGLGKALGEKAVDLAVDLGEKAFDRVLVKDVNINIYLIEIKCRKCDFVVKRYYTDKIE